MAKTNFKSVDEYIASQPVELQRVLERVRGAIRKAVPGAEEVISYQMPAYKLHGRLVIYFAGYGAVAPEDAFFDAVGRFCARCRSGSTAALFSSYLATIFCASWSNS
jgi:uncharacterized protein YdhG (YjbR/CyaY superfamily)